MSVIEIHSKSEPQPWMAYKCGLSNSRSLDCCSSLFTDTTALLPFQIISTSPFEKIEISPYDEDSWAELTLTIHEELIEGLWFISYHGDALAAPLTCGTYDMQLTAGDVWMFEPITVKDFEITTNTFTIKDDLFLPFEFLEQQVNNTPILAPVDSFLPFMYATPNLSTAPEYYLVNEDGTETLLTITVDVKIISGKTYYIHEAECFYPFLDCGNYYLKIIDGVFTYYSVWFHAESNISDIPDGYKPILDSENKITFNNDCSIAYSICSDIGSNVKTGLLYNGYAVVNAKGIAPTGWHIPTQTELNTLSTFCGGSVAAGGKLKEIGTTNWQTPNTGATDIYGFMAKGLGCRLVDGFGFSYYQQRFIFWTKTLDDFEYYVGLLEYNSDDFYVLPGGNKEGYSIRCIRDNSTGWVTGQVAQDIDGNTYHTVQIGTQIWMVESLAVTHYKDGTIIPEVTDQTAWENLITGALCAYNNDWDNVFI